MLEFICWILFIVVAIPLSLFVIECVCSLFYRAPSVASLGDSDHSDARCVILIPAHNEELVIQSTLDSLKPEIQGNDQILVVADNCNDTTADIVRNSGCHVSERQDANNRGKGFALAHGLDQLKENPPQVVIIVDADCEAIPGTIQRLKAAAIQYQRPVQSRYLLQSPEGAGIKTKVSEFAVLIKNRIRTKGLSFLGAPIPLLGSGMAFLWQDITSVPLASGEIVEDMKLGIELAGRGKGALYDDQTVILSDLPVTQAALEKQRERWEHGHMGMIQKFAGPLLAATVKSKSKNLLLFFLDLIIPPLSLLLMFTLVVFLFFAVMNIFANLNTILSLVILLVLAVMSCIFLSWLFAGRQILSPKELLHLPLYVLSKLGVYKGFVEKKQTTWNRTDRD